jgi:hypothetical protein
MALLEVRAKTDDASVRAKTDYAPLQRQIVRRRGRFEVGLHASKTKQNFLHQTHATLIETKKNLYITNQTSKLNSDRIIGFLTIKTSKQDLT